MPLSSIPALRHEGWRWYIRVRLWLLFLVLPVSISQAERPRLTSGVGIFGKIGEPGFLPPVAPGFLSYNGRYAQAPMSMPMALHRLVDAANRLQGKPYVWGGGHRYLHDRGYDCSGAVSFVLHQAGLLRGPLVASQFRSYGRPGPGRLITIYASDDHVFMSVCGLRFDTSDQGSGRGEGPRWRPTSRNTRGYVIRHPPGL